MALDRLVARAEDYLRTLCVQMGNRRTGSEGNRAAADFFARTAASFGFAVETQPFECMDWSLNGAVSLVAGDRRYEAFAGPYSPACDLVAPLVVASSVRELEALDLRGKLLLLRGAIAAEQLMPKNFPFYNPDEHRRIIAALEAKGPAAVIAATGRDVQMACSQYPYPLIEDGDFDIPSAYLTDVDGEALARHEGQQAALAFQAERISSKGWNAIARRPGESRQRAVFAAHIDAKAGSPGAIDNAGGVAVLLLLAELCRDYNGDLGLELVAMNGEDYYSNPGEQVYLAQNAGRFDEILLGINVDGAGYRRGSTAYSLYDCSPQLTGAVRDAFGGYTEMVEGDPWYQGDHSLFLANRRPALAITSERAAELVSEITHSPRDTPEVLDCSKLTLVATALRELVSRLEQVSTGRQPVAPAPTEVQG